MNAFAKQVQKTIATEIDLTLRYWLDGGYTASDFTKLSNTLGNPETLKKWTRTVLFENKGYDAIAKIAINQALDAIDWIEMSLYFCNEAAILDMTARLTKIIDREYSQEWGDFDRDLGNDPEFTNWETSWLKRWREEKRSLLTSSRDIS